MVINIRKAEPGDVSVVFPLVYSSGPHEFDYVFCVGDKTFKEYFHFAYPRHFGINSHRVYMVATIDDQVVGIVAFFSGKDRLLLDLGNFWNVFRFYGPASFPKIARAASHIDTIIMPLKPDDFYIGHLGVKKECRGQGIGSTLIRHGMKLAQAKGFQKCCLDVATTNLQARKLYERLGFRVVAEYKWNYPNSPIPVPGESRMELVL